MYVHHLQSDEFIRLNPRDNYPAGDKDVQAPIDNYNIRTIRIFEINL
jgi:hypothetical protein